MRKFLLVMMGVLLSLSSYASHLSGGDIQYRYIGDSTGVARHYKVILRLYRDVTGIGLPTNETVTVSSNCYANISVPVSLVPGSGVVSPTLFDCVIPSTFTKTLEIYMYVGYVTLPGNCNTYRFWYQNCCRPPGITNIAGSSGAGFYFDAELDNASQGQNSSPIFVSEPVRAFCVGNPFNWKQTAIEEDGDSIVYSLINCRQNAYPNQADIPYLAGWTTQQPVTSSYFNLNPNTGLITFLPTQTEIDILSVLVEEYRFDTVWGYWFKVGSASRDMMISVSPICAPAVMNGVSLDFTAPGHYIDPLTGYPTVDYECGDTAVTIYFDIALDCYSISPDGTDFRLTGPNGQPWPVKRAEANCNVNAESDSITLILYKPLAVNGLYYLYSKIGNDGNTILNKCGIGMSEFDTLVLKVDDCVNIIMELENVTVVNDQYTKIEWSVDTTTFFTDLFEKYVIIREDIGWTSVGHVNDYKQTYFYDQTAVGVDALSYNYKVYMVYNSFDMDTTRAVHSILVKSSGQCDTLCLTWNSYNGWTNPMYDVYLRDMNTMQWNKLTQTPISDTTYCGIFDTLETGFNSFKVVTTNNLYTSESNYTECYQEAPPELIIPNVITPNNDGVNDRFYIRGLELYDTRPIIIINRWGIIVYFNENYTNDWDGGKLSDGVYFYVLEVWDGDTSFTFNGIITLLR